MNDIVKRMRQMVLSRLAGYHDPEICAALNEAADQIIALQARIKELENGQVGPPPGAC